MNIGVYEYRDGVQQVYCTERIPQIFGWTDEETAYYTGDRVHLYTFIEELRRSRMVGERNVYRIPGRAGPLHKAGGNARGEQCFRRGERRDGGDAAPHADRI